MNPDGPALLSSRSHEAAEAVRPCDVCALDAMRCGQTARVVRLAGSPRARRRLAALGVRPSTRCELLGRSPAGGPLHLRAGSVHLMIRADEAAGVLVLPEARNDDDAVRPV